MDDCIFCKIVKDELPSAKVYEDEQTLAFLDIRPVSSGHTLVLPKKHSNTLLETDDEAVKNLLPIVKKIGRAVMDATGAGGFNLNVNNGRAAGQIVDHLHIHIVPRFIGDGLKLWPQREYNDGEMTEMADKIKAAL